MSVQCFRMACMQRFLFNVAITGLFSTIVVSYNPLLTYTVRIKKMSFNPNISGEYIVNQYREKQFVSGNFTLYSNETVDTVVAIFYRCNLEGFDCEYFQTWKLTDICPKLKDKNQIWSSWYGAFHPPMVCPLNKVHYKVKNGTFEVDKILLLYPEATNYYWKLVQKMYYGNTFIGSYTMEFSMFGYRKKSKSFLNVLTS